MDYRIIRLYKVRLWENNDTFHKIIVIYWIPVLFAEKNNKKHIFYRPIAKIYYIYGYMVSSISLSHGWEWNYETLLG
jgi:hypothetical protein